MDGENNGKGNVGPVEIQSYLSGVDYPASKQSLVGHAQSQGAPQEVLDILQELDEKEYQSPAEVTQEVGRTE
jgi:hypothetical protein